MHEQAFIQSIHAKSTELNINPLLLISGIEGIYSFRDVALNAINYELLDSLILTIFALRIGDKFHELAEQNLGSTNSQLLQGGATELHIIPLAQIEASGNHYLQSFAKILSGKSPVRAYHVKALEVAALEIRKAQIQFGRNSIGAIVLRLCKEDLSNDIDLGSLFSH
jgi:hypothetical protein